MSEPKPSSESLEEVRFHDMAHGGEAVGRLSDGRAVFVGGVIPGERAKVRLTASRKKWARGDLVELLEASPEFCMAISYNPGYQSVLKDLKQSTRQRFVALEFDYPAAELESRIIVNETGIDAGMAAQLVKFAQMTRNLKGSGLEEGASTRLLVHAAKLMKSGVSPVVACRTCIAEALTDDGEMLTAVHELSASVF